LSATRGDAAAAAAVEGVTVEEAVARMEQIARETAVGDTMYEKRWVIENLLCVGKHFQQTSYYREEEGERVVVELCSHPGIEDKLCTLWDIATEEDVSSFFLDCGALDIFVELFTNPNHRVKEIAVGVMANMVCHEKVFLAMVERNKYLEKLLRLLEVQDSPTLSLVFRCLHTYGYNLFTLLHHEPAGPRSRGQDRVDHNSRLQAQQLASTWLTFLSTEAVARGVGVIVASTTSKEVLSNSARLLSMLCSLWEGCEEREAKVQHYREETFIQCVLEGVEESLGEDRTVKHLVAFLHGVCEQDMDKDQLAGLSGRLLVAVDRLVDRHILAYSSIDCSDLELLSSVGWLARCCLDSGGFSSLPQGLEIHLKAAVDLLEEGGRVEEEEQSGEGRSRGEVLALFRPCLARLEGMRREKEGEESPARS